MSENAEHVHIWRLIARDMNEPATEEHECECGKRRFVKVYRDMSRYVDDGDPAFLELL